MLYKFKRNPQKFTFLQILKNQVTNFCSMVGATENAGTDLTLTDQITRVRHMWSVIVRSVNTDLTMTDHKQQSWTLRRETAGTRTCDSATSRLQVRTLNRYAATPQ